MSLLQLRQAAAAPWGAPLLRGIDLTLDRGQILGLAGPNGAGKTSLLHLMAGDIPLSAGSVLIDGRPPTEWPRRALARRLAYLPQLSLLNFPYTVEEVVALGRIPHDSGAGRDEAIMTEVMAAADITPLRRRLYTRLSGGEKQRVQLARILAQVWDADTRGGGLLLLDEPTAALDLAHQQLVLAAVRNLAVRGCAVVLVIHDLNLIAATADQVAVLQDGRLVAAGPPSVVFTEALFREVFAIDVLIQRHPDRNHPLVITR